MRLPKLLVVSAIGVSLACFAGLASSQQIYRWKDANGVIHFAQSPPPNGVHYTKMHLDAQPEVSSNPAPAPEATAPSAEAPAAATPPPSSATQADTPSNREKLCRQLSENITLLQGKQPVVTGGANGKQEVMGDSAREQQLATARAQQTQYCSAGGGAG